MMLFGGALDKLGADEPTQGEHRRRRQHARRTSTVTA